MFAKALAGDIAYLASHCFCGFCIAYHGSIIQRALVVCQAKSADNSLKNSPLRGWLLVALDSLSCILPAFLAQYRATKAGKSVRRIGNQWEGLGTFFTQRKSLGELPRSIG